VRQQRGQPVRVADGGLNPGRLELRRAGWVACGAANRVTRGGQRLRERTPAAAATDDENPCHAPN
jgi:hypothetical protein